MAQLGENAASHPPSTVNGSASLLPASTPTWGVSTWLAAQRRPQRWPRRQPKGGHKCPELLAERPPQKESGHRGGWPFPAALGVTTARQPTLSPASPAAQAAHREAVHSPHGGATSGRLCLPPSQLNCLIYSRETSKQVH